VFGDGRGEEARYSGWEVRRAGRERERQREVRSRNIFAYPIFLSYLYTAVEGARDMAFLSIPLCWGGGIPSEVPTDLWYLLGTCLLKISG
jgi:hypothetical protein